MQPPRSPEIDVLSLVVTFTNNQPDFYVSGSLFPNFFSKIVEITFNSKDCCCKQEIKQVFGRLKFSLCGGSIGDRTPEFSLQKENFA